MIAMLPNHEISLPNQNVPVRRGATASQWAGFILFFLSVYLYVWLFIKPSLIYHGFGIFLAYPAFSLGWGFLNSSLSYPGGLVEYIGGFLSQLYYFSWLGALVITAAACLIYIETSILIRLSAGRALKLIGYIPAVMLLMICNHYDNQLTAFLALLVALWFSVVYEKMAVRRSVACAVVFMVMFAMLYYIAGGASFVFVSLVSIYELFVGRRKVLAVLFPAAVIGTYLVGRYVFDLEIEIIHLRFLGTRLGYDLWVRNIVICVYLFFPLALFGIGLRQGLAGKKSSVCGAEKDSGGSSLKAGKLRQLFQDSKGGLIVEAGLPIIILLASILVSFDGTKKKLIQVDYFAHQKMWPEVLRTARRIRSESCDLCCIHNIDRALYYTGRLGDEMFRYPQMVPALMLTGMATGHPVGVFTERGLLFLELGYLGNAERDAFEYMELVGSTPLILEQLATIKLAKGQLEAAKVFLNALSKDLIFGNRAREMLRRIEQDPELADDERIQYIRSVASDKESVNLGVDDFFHQLLDKNSNNKLAFEYMMAFYLLTKQVDKVVANIGGFNDLGYKKLPRYYEEAIMLYMAHGGPRTDLHGWMPRLETIERARAAGRIYQLCGGRYNEKEIRGALTSDLADSYFLYHAFHVLGERK
ncbi:MAG: DUF6057 family protein [Phycisphaerae bacterium]|nr:DUF6057 family protein [Phycisphaerae bacterium]